jgi:hypothetical protein
MPNKGSTLGRPRKQGRHSTRRKGRVKVKEDPMKFKEGRLAPLADPYLDRDLVEFGVILRDLDPGVHDDRQYRSRVRSLCELSRDIYLLLVPVECSPAEKVADAVKLFKQAVESIRTSRLDSDTRRYRDNIADRAKELEKEMKQL